VLVARDYINRAIKTKKKLRGNELVFSTVLCGTFTSISGCRTGMVMIHELNRVMKVKNSPPGLGSAPWKTPLCAFLLLRKPRFMVGVILVDRAGSTRIRRKPSFERNISAVDITRVELEALAKFDTCQDSTHLRSTQTPKG